MRGEGYHHLNDENHSEGSGIGQFESIYATTKNIEEIKKSVRNHRGGKSLGWKSYMNKRIVKLDLTERRLQWNNHVIKIGRFGIIKENQQDGTRSTYQTTTTR